MKEELLDQKIIEEHLAKLDPIMRKIWEEGMKDCPPGTPLFYPQKEKPDAQ